VESRIGTRPGCASLAKIILDGSYYQLERIHKKMKEKDFKIAALDLCRTTERYAIMRSGLFQIENKNCQDSCSNGGKCEEICGDNGYCCSNKSGNCPRGKSNIQ